MAEVITAEEVVENQPEQKSQFTLATVTKLFSRGTAQISFDGEETPSEKEYSYLSSYHPSEGDRVVLADVAGTHIILGSISHKVEPSPEVPKSIKVSSVTTSSLTTSSLTVNSRAYFSSSDVKFNNGFTTNGLTNSGSTKLSGSIGFFGRSPQGQKYVGYASSDTQTRNKLNTLLQKLAEFGLIYN